MSSYFYRGRHRKPTHTGRNLAVLASTGALTVPALGLASAPAARAGVLDDIAQCESSGNPQASNGSHFGLFQFDLSTWRSVGGSGDPRDASVAEQYRRAQTLLSRRGTQPWVASRNCHGHTVAAGAARAPSAARPSPARAPHRAAKPSWSRAAAGGARAADGTGSYVCSPATLAFDACDPATLGQRLAYPRYDGHAGRRGHRAVPAGSGYTVRAGDTLTRIAAVHRTSWRALYRDNPQIGPDPNLIRPGQHLAL